MGNFVNNIERGRMEFNVVELVKSSIYLGSNVVESTSEIIQKFMGDKRYIHSLDFIRGISEIAFSYAIYNQNDLDKDILKIEMIDNNHIPYITLYEKYTIIPLPEGYQFHNRNYGAVYTIVGDTIEANRTKDDEYCIENLEIFNTMIEKLLLEIVGYR